MEADTVNIFKNRLDKYWTNQEVFNDFNADLTRTGDLLICIWMCYRQDAGIEEYLRPSELIRLDWIVLYLNACTKIDDLVTQNRSVHSISVSILAKVTS